MLTSRVGQLLSQGVPPADIVAITFTRKARDEMKARLARLVGPISQQVLIGTFHSIGHSILRKCARPLPLDAPRSGPERTLLICNSPGR